MASDFGMPEARSAASTRRTAAAFALPAPFSTWSDGSSSSAKPSSTASLPPIQVSASISFAIAFWSAPVRAA